MNESHRGIMKMLFNVERRRIKAERVQGQESRGDAQVIERRGFVLIMERQTFI